MDCLISLDESSINAYKQLFHALSLVPISHYVMALTLIWAIFLYNLMEIHFFQDLFSGFRGDPVTLTFHPSSHIYHGVVSKCRILRGRYLVTPWLSSPHFQIAFLNFFGNPPVFSYRRQLFQASDGGTIALDWLTSSDVSRGSFEMNNAISEDETTPLVVVIPGLTSDSTSVYIKHLAFGMAKRGWNVVVSNHRGLGGVSITSDCFYNAGWTEDTRVVIDYLHHQYPKAPLFAIGTSIGANILVKYLGEDREKVPVAGAVAICSPWDLLDELGNDVKSWYKIDAAPLMLSNWGLIKFLNGKNKICQAFCQIFKSLMNGRLDYFSPQFRDIYYIGDRFICRRLVQKLYDRALTIGLQGYAKLHEPRYSQLANWEGIKKSRSIRDFDNFATCLVGKFETVDTYYRRCSSSSYVPNVSVPLLCISALDDPVCTREAIPWDECRANKNIVLATPKRGGHLAFFEGITASSLWWVRATDEFLGLLHSSPHMHVQKTENSGPQLSMGSSIDQGPYVNIAEDGMVAAVANEQAGNNVVEDLAGLGKTHNKECDKMASATEPKQHPTAAKSDVAPTAAAQVSGQSSNLQGMEYFDVIASVKRCLNQLSRQNGKSMWLLAYIAIITSWPIVGSALRIFSKKKLRNVSPANSRRR